MKKTRILNMPIVGNIQHGEKINNKVKEYGYFIAKTKNSHMQIYIDKFDKLLKGKQSIEIEFVDEYPLSKQYVRYNQSGTVCKRAENSNNAVMRTKEVWKDVQCNTFDCVYRQKNEVGKRACNRIGWLRFLVPSICKDRVFLMKITGQDSIDNLDGYINLQKAQGKSVKGLYTLFLYQKTQTNSFCQSFNNYVVDILSKEDFDSNNSIPQITQNQKELSTSNDQNVNNQAQSQKSTTNNAPAMQETIEDKTQKLQQESDNKKVSKTTTKKETKSKSKSTKKAAEDKETKTTVENKNSSENENSKNDKKDAEENFDNCYILLKTFNKTFTIEGVQKEYFMGEFTDMNDTPVEIAIKPDYVEELSKCDLGTVVRLDTQDVANIKFAIKLEFIDKRIKKIAA